MSRESTQARGVVQRIADGQAVVRLDGSACQSCGSQCGIGSLAANRSSELCLAAVPGLQPGDAVAIGMPAERLCRAALLGYFFPALAMLLGACIGALFGGTDGSAALGAIAGFLGALTLVRILVGLPPPEIVPLSGRLAGASPLIHQEQTS